MAEEFVPIMCYHGGRIVMQGRRPEYDGGSMDGILMNKSILYPDLLKKVCELTSNDPQKFKLIMKCRFPTSGSDFVALEVKDETTTKMMFGLYPRVYSLELFVEKFSINDEDERVESIVREAMEMRSEGGDSLTSSLHGMNEEPDPINSNHLLDNASQPSIRTCGTIAEPNGRDGSYTTDPIE
ncbi:hypothetical protein KSP40_PGU000127 [Platanthera guangdongensis]|uniref:Uncharacterized protein n=1 Tax=Platanthera guangdongensis TaxID=2320717 RepID=A0ABR2LWI4_9ASPA